MGWQGQVNTRWCRRARGEQILKRLHSSGPADIIDSPLPRMTGHFQSLAQVVLQTTPSFSNPGSVPPIPSSTPFWQHPDFVISTAIGIIGLGFTVWAVLEARAAKKAAIEAGRTVKMHTVAIELMEISQRLDSLDFTIDFPDARDFLNAVNRKLRRLIAPFQNYPEFEESVASIRESLTNAKASLNGVRQQPGAPAANPGVVYNAIEADLATISGYVADLLGHMETKSVNIPQPEGPAHPPVVEE